MKLILLRHGERIDQKTERTQEAGITPESRQRLQKLGEGWGKERYDAILIVHGPKLRAKESANALASGMKGKKVKLEERQEADEYAVAELQKKDASGQRIPGAVLFEKILHGEELSSKETIRYFVKRCLIVLAALVKTNPENALIIVIHHDFGIDLVLKEILGQRYQPTGKTRFQREEFAELHYEKGKLQEIVIPKDKQHFS